MALRLLLALLLLALPAAAQLDKAEDALKRGRWLEVVSALEKVPAGNARAAWLAGFAHLELMEFPQALAFYEKALELDPGNPEYSLSRCIALVRVRRFEEALGEIGRHPLAAQLQVERALALMGLGRKTEVEALLASLPEADRRRFQWLARYLPFEPGRMALIGRLRRSQQQERVSQPELQELVRQLEATLGPTDVDTVVGLRWLASTTTSPLAATEAAFRRALQAASTDLATRSDVLYSYLDFLRVSHDFVRAEPLARQLVADYESLYGSENAATALSVAQLGAICAGLGKWTEAWKHLEVATTVLKRVKSPKVAFVEELAGKTFLDQGNYPQAQRFLHASNDQKYSHTGAQVAAAECSLLSATLPGKARFDLQDAALEHLDKGGPVALDYRRQRAGWLALQGDPEGALRELQETLGLAEASAGPKHPLTAATLHDLAALLLERGQVARAEPLAGRALALHLGYLGPDHWRTGQARMLWARVLHARKSPAALKEAKAAEKVLEASLGGNHPLVLLGLCEQALMLPPGEGVALLRAVCPRLDNRLGRHHPMVWRVQLSYLQQMADAGRLGTDPVYDNSLARAQVEGQQQFLDQMLFRTNERERLQVEGSLTPYGLLPNLARVAATRDASARSLAEVALRTKGVVLESMLEEISPDFILTNTADKRAADLRQQQINFMRIRIMRAELKTLELTGDPRSAAYRKNLEGWERTALPTTFFHQRASLTTKLGDVQKALSEGSVLVEIVRCPVYAGAGRWEEVYGAAVIPRQGDPSWVELGPAARLDPLVGRCQKALRRGEGALAPVLREAYDLCAAPFVKALPPGTNTLVLSPDGELSFLPYAALLEDPEHFLGERFQVLNVNSGRDLLHVRGPATSAKVLVMGNPTYKSSSGPALACAPLSDAATRELRFLSFADLPGAARECRDLVSLLGGLEVELDLGDQATEARFRRMAPSISPDRKLMLPAEPAPHILHLATHGFFLPPMRLGSQPGAPLLDNPRARSGLALAGAQATMEAWKAGTIPDPANDGIVTADDVSSLDLKGTWLVTLSACETGTGEAVRGEGVVGLRRAFVLAGTQNLLMTLWPVNDDVTRQLMLEFYGLALSSHHAASALALTQRHWLARLRTEQGVEAAARLAGPFVLVFQGPP